MATLKTLKIEKGLLNKGFRCKKSHHKFFVLYYNEKKTSIMTKISNGETEIGDPLIKMMAKETGLTKDQFTDLIECPLSYKEYIRILFGEGKIKE